MSGSGGALLHLVSICWSASQLTDGHIPAAAVLMLCHEADVPKSTPARLVEAELWLPTGQDFYVKDYLEMNPSRGEIEEETRAVAAPSTRVPQPPQAGLMTECHAVTHP